MWKINLNNNFIAWRPTQEKVWTKSYKKMKTSSFFFSHKRPLNYRKHGFWGATKTEDKRINKKARWIFWQLLFSRFFVFPADHHKLRSWFNKPLANNQDIELAEGKKKLRLETFQRMSKRLRKTFPNQERRFDSALKVLPQVFSITMMCNNFFVMRARTMDNARNVETMRRRVGSEWKKVL